MNNSKMVLVGVALIALLGGGIFVATRDKKEDTKSSNSSTTATPTPTMKEDAMSKKDIVDTAVATADLSTLVAAVKAADLVDTLKSAGPFTVFAPTNAAFAKLPAGTLDTLLKPENKEQLASILKYHVVSGKVLSSDLKDGQVVTTVQGEKLTVSIKGSEVMITDAKGNANKVAAADVMTSNGVVHVIDGVLLP